MQIHKLYKKHIHKWLQNIKPLLHFFFHLIYPGYYSVLAHRGLVRSNKYKIDLTSPPLINT